MKKYISVLVLSLVLSYPVSVMAQGQQGSGSQQGSGVQQQDRVQDPVTHEDAVMDPQGSGMQNQNQVQVQNQGEETQIQSATQYMQQLMSMEGLNESVGKQVKEVAQEQIQAQTKIQEQQDKVGSRSMFMKKLIGPDLDAIESLKYQVEQNQLRIQLLTQLKTEVVNQADETQIDMAIQALIDQNTSLQEQINSEEEVSGIFGWIVRLFR